MISSDWPLAELGHRLLEPLAGLLLGDGELLGALGLLAGLGHDRQSIRVRRHGNGPGASIFERLRRALRGSDRARSPALPVGEALHPATLAAVLILCANDWIGKPRLGPGLITG